MHIAVDISPLKTGHKVRGTGSYTENLTKALSVYFPEHTYSFTFGRMPSEIDVVHYPYFDPFFLTLPVKRNYKMVVTVHDLTPIVLSGDFPIGIGGKAKWMVQKNLLRTADAIITDSNSSKKDIMQFVNIPEKKIHVTYLAAGESFKKLRTQEIEKVLKKYHVPKDFILYVGDVTNNKNLPRLIQAIKKTNTKAVLVGKALRNEKYDKKNLWNRDLNQVHFLVDEDKQFILLGFVEEKDLIALYNAATLFVMPSLYEGFGLPILEAMSCGCPVITSQEGSLHEVSADAAIFVDPYSIESMTNGLQQLLQDKKLADLYSKKGLARSKAFSWKKTAEATIKVYEEVVGRK